MNNDPDFQALVAFVEERLAANSSMPGIHDAASVILRMARDYQDEMAPDYAGGYADSAEDSLRAISGIWRYHPDYRGWAETERSEELFDLVRDAITTEFGRQYINSLRPFFADQIDLDGLAHAVLAAIREVR